MKVKPPSALAPLPAASRATATLRKVFCASAVDEWDVPRCLHTLTPEEQRGRGWSLQLTLENDRVIRKDTISGPGALIDDSSRVSSRLYHYDAGRVVEIEGRDHNEVVRARTRFVHEEGANVVVWVDDRERPLPISGTRATMVVRKLDEWGRIVEVTYLDLHGVPTVNDEGVNVVRKAYALSGRFLSEAYFDGSLAPVSNKDGVHKIAYEYDAWGERLAKRYFDPEGSPVLSSRDRFHELRHRRDALRNPIEWGYYDLRGERVICPTDDAAFGRFELNEYGSEVRLDYFGLSGERRMSAYGFATRVRKLDATDEVIEWSHFDAAGKPVARNFGHSVLVTTRDERGNATRDMFLDLSRRPVRNREGYAEARMTYDERDNCTSTAYFDEQGQPTLVLAGYHARAVEFDGDREFRTVYTDLLGNRVDTNKGYAERIVSYEEGGAVARNQYFDAARNELKPLPPCTGKFEPNEKATLTRALGKVGACGKASEARTWVLRINIDELGQAKTYVPIGARPDEATNGCLRNALADLRLPRPSAGCTNVTVELAPATSQRIRILTLGDERAPELPPG